MTDYAAPAQPAAPARSKIRSRLFLKYTGLFVAVVCLALLVNGVFEIWGSYRENKESLIRIQHEQAEAEIHEAGGGGEDRRASPPERENGPPETGSRSISRLARCTAVKR